MAVLLLLVPPGKYTFKGAEPADAARLRYAQIAADVEAVAAEMHGNDTEAAMMVAIAYHESGLRADVDDGRVRGGGRDTCIMQVRPRNPKEADELATDRKACFRRGLALVRNSLRVCRKNKREERFAAYASGSCDRGLAESRGIAAIVDRVLKLKAEQQAKAKLDAVERL